MSATPDDWKDMGAWWLEELRADPSYESDVTPLVISLLGAPGCVLDIGCGEGRTMRALQALGHAPVGVDISQPLLRRAHDNGSVVRGQLPDMSYLASDVFDGAVLVLVLEHLTDHRLLFEEIARVVRSGGYFALVMNHPIYTAPGSAPIEDSEGEVLWRVGTYLASGFTDEPVGGGIVRFHHRPLGQLLSAASETGWSMQRLIELGVSEDQINRHPPLDAQRHLPRLLGVRWERR